MVLMMLIKIYKVMRMPIPTRVYKTGVAGKRQHQTAAGATVHHGG